MRSSGEEPVGQPLGLEDEHDLEGRVQQVIGQLCDEFAGTCPRDMVERCARESFDEFREARITMYVPIFVYRITRERLKVN